MAWVVLTDVDPKRPVNARLIALIARSVPFKPLDQIGIELQR